MIRTARLTLRRARMDDLPAMHRVLSDARAMLYWSTPPHERLSQTESWLISMVEADPAVSEDFVIDREGEVIGKIGAYRLPDFGYILHPDHWGIGLASEAMAAFLAHAAAERPDIDHLAADVDPRNSGSIRLLLKHGFRETGRAERTWHTHLGWCDSVYFRKDFGDASAPVRRD